MSSANDDGRSTEEETAGGDNDDSDIDEPLPPPTSAEAMSSLRTLPQWMESVNCTDYSSCYAVENIVQSKLNLHGILIDGRHRICACSQPCGRIHIVDCRHNAILCLPFIRIARIIE